MSEVARRYARAAVDTAAEKSDDEVDALAEGMKAFRTAYHESDDLRQVVLNPALRDHRDVALDGVFKKLASGDLSQRLVMLLADNERVDVLDEVTDQIEAIADERAGRLRAQVVSATDISKKHQTRIAKALERRFGRPVVLSIEVDPELLGGLVCRVGDFTLDSSVRRQLDILRERLGATAH